MENLWPQNLWSSSRTCCLQCSFPTIAGSLQFHVTSLYIMDSSSIIAMVDDKVKHQESLQTKFGLQNSLIFLTWFETDNLPSSPACGWIGLLICSLCYYKKSRKPTETLCCVFISVIMIKMWSFWEPCSMASSYQLQKTSYHGCPQVFPVNLNW